MRAGVRRVVHLLHLFGVAKYVVSFVQPLPYLYCLAVSSFDWVFVFGRGKFSITNILAGSTVRQFCLL